MYTSPFEGRMNRQNFIYAQLLLMVLIAVFSAIVFRNGVTLSIIQDLIPILILGTIPQIILVVRRLHDINTSGIWSFLILTPYISLLFAVFLAVKQGTVGVNNYGNPDTRPFLESLLNKTG